MWRCGLSVITTYLCHGRIVLLCCVLVAMCAGISVGADGRVVELDEVLLRLEERHGNIKTMAAEFRQEKYFSFMTKPVVSKGFILFSVPDKIRFDIVSPFSTTLLDDGKKVGRYEMVGGKWRKVQFGGGKSIKFVMDQIAQWMQGKFSDQRNIFELSVSAGDPNSYAFLDLTPRIKQIRQYIEKIRVRVSDGPGYRISRIEIFEPGGDRFSLIFTKEVVNRELGADYFSDPERVSDCRRLFEKAKAEDGGK